ncbi:MAG: gluconokinase [Candidatus Woesearchaeota archaeon]|jgi:hypothetical protein
MYEEVQRIKEALSNPKGYPHESKQIKVITTAVSLVFLTGDYAYKINKPLNLGFLDFSTLEKRKEQCEKEVKYNSLISPQLYEKVVPITKDSNGNIKIDGAGIIIEYAIKMKQMDSEATMENLLRKNQVHPTHIKQLAHKIHAFHKVAPTDEHISSFGKTEMIQFNWDENFEQTDKYRGELISQEGFSFIKEQINKFITKNKDLFERRVTENQTKHCHGDFHSGNVFVTNDDLHIFDGIVFNERFPCSDVIAEVAFMAMDLDHHERSDLSTSFVDEYQKVSKDKDIPELLDFYKCYRSYIRAKINCFTWEDPNLTPEKKLFHAEEAKKYFELSKHYAEQW